MKRTISLVSLILSVILISTALAGTDIAPAPKDKCAVCGMFVIKYPDWSAMIEYKSGQRVWFDGAKDLLKGYGNPAKYGLPKDRTTIKTIQVKDYYSLKMVDGRTAYYVIGSDVYGPMGHELVPFATEKDAKGFLNDHRGKKILRFDQLTPDILKTVE